MILKHRSKGAIMTRVIDFQLRPDSLTITLDRQHKRDSAFPDPDDPPNTVAPHHARAQRSRCPLKRLGPIGPKRFAWCGLSGRREV
jgi:hypothetical protein